MATWKPQSHDGFLIADHTLGETVADLASVLAGTPKELTIDVTGLRDIDDLVSSAICQHVTSYHGSLRVNIVGPRLAAYSLRKAFRRLGALP